MRKFQRGAMHGVFWLLGLAALAVALALLMGHNLATVTLFWPPYRYDVSFNLVVFAVVAVFVLLHLALRALGALRQLPAQAQRWRAQQLERAVVAGVLDALSHQLAGRFVRAQSAARHALGQLQSSALSTWPRRDQLELLAHLMLAESAQSLQNREQRDLHLQAALAPGWAKKVPHVHEGVLLRAVRWAVEDRDLDTARSRLAELPQGAARRIQALRLKLRVARLAQAHSEALETARVLAKHRAFSPTVAHSLVRTLALDALAQAHDDVQLQTVWRKLSPTERAMPDLVLAAAQRVLQLADSAPPDATDDEEGGAPSQALQALRAWLEPLWPVFGSLDMAQQGQFVRLFEAVLPQLDAAGLARLEHSQQQLPNNPLLQYLTGQACRQRQLWGRASLLLTQASHSLQDRELLRRTWCALAELAQGRGDEAAAQHAWKQAALVPLGIKAA